MTLFVSVALLAFYLFPLAFFQALKYIVYFFNTEKVQEGTKAKRFIYNIQYGIPLQDRERSELYVLRPCTQ